MKKALKKSSKLQSGKKPVKTLKAKAKTPPKKAAPAKPSSRAKTPLAKKFAAKKSAAPKKPAPKTKAGKARVKAKSKTKAKAKPATAAQILGFPPKRKSKPAPLKKIKREWEKNYRHLLELHELLMDKSNGVVKDASEQISPYSMHMADSGTDNYDRDFALQVLSTEQNALNEIEQALRRIEHGTYGVCELTGKPIPKRRLNAIPWTRFTVQAQQQLEKEGVVSRPRLGELGTAKKRGGSAVPAEVTEESSKDEEDESDE